MVTSYVNKFVPKRFASAKSAENHKRWVHRRSPRYGCHLCPGVSLEGGAFFITINSLLVVGVQKQKSPRASRPALPKQRVGQSGQRWAGRRRSGRGRRSSGAAIIDQPAGFYKRSVPREQPFAAEEVHRLSREVAQHRAGHEERRHDLAEVSGPLLETIDKVITKDVYLLIVSHINTEIPLRLQLYGFNLLLKRCLHAAVDMQSNEMRENDPFEEKRPGVEADQITKCNARLD